MNTELIIVTGISGSGKSLTLTTLEDLGFICIDNLPLNLIPEILQNQVEQVNKIAICIDTRNIQPHSEVTNLDIQALKFKSIFDRIRDLKIKLTTIYLDADDNTLIKRFNSTRRKHPLFDPEKHNSLSEAIKLERKILTPLAHAANIIIVTSTMSPNDLRTEISHYLQLSQQHQLSIIFQSFGFKFGIPQEADYIFDIRCLPNPYWQDNLRGLNGLDPSIADYLENQPETSLMYNDIHTFLHKWLPKFALHKMNLTVAIGCTGGQHRSVYFANKLAQDFKKMHNNVQIKHRDLA